MFLIYAGGFRRSPLVSAQFWPSLLFSPSCGFCRRASFLRNTRLLCVVASPKFFRITSFADPYPLTPIESHLYKIQGEGSPWHKISASSLHRLSVSPYFSILKGNLHVPAH